MAAFEIWTFVLKAKRAAVSWTGAAVALALGTFGDRFVALSNALTVVQVSTVEKIPGTVVGGSTERIGSGLTHFDVSFATQGTASTVRNPHHGAR